MCFILLLHFQIYKISVNLAYAYAQEKRKERSREAEASEKQESERERNACMRWKKACREQKYQTKIKCRLSQEMIVSKMITRVFICSMQC